MFIFNLLIHIFLTFVLLSCIYLWQWNTTTDDSTAQTIQSLVLYPQNRFPLITAKSLAELFIIAN